MNTEHIHFFDMLLDMIQANIDEGNKKEAAALLMHGARLAKALRVGEGLTHEQLSNGEG